MYTASKGVSGRGVVISKILRKPTSYKLVFKLFLRKFKKRRWNIPIGAFVAISIIESIIKFIIWIFKGISEEALFSPLVTWIGGRIDMRFLMEYPQLIVPIIASIGIIIILIIMYIHTQKQIRNGDIIRILDQMHREMRRLTSKQLSEHPYTNIKNIKEEAPFIMDTLGLIPLNKWESWLSSTRSRVRRKIPQNTKKNIRFYYFKAIAEITTIQHELYNSKEWGVADAMNICQWLNEHHWHLDTRREKSKKWQSLYNAAKPYIADEGVGEYIETHIKLSYVICNRILIYEYAKKWPNSTYSKQLFMALIKSFYKIEAENELNQIYRNITAILKIRESVLNEVEI